MEATARARRPSEQPLVDPRSAPHAAEAGDVAVALGLDVSSGLTSAEVDARRLASGTNEIRSTRTRSAWRLLVNQFFSLIVALLAAAALLAFVTRDLAEGFAIVAVLLLNAAIGFFTEWEAERALDALRRQASTTCRVRRNGVESTIAASELVEGDLVIIEAGDLVPADARIIRSASLRVDEASLTGESEPVEKDERAIELTAVLPERTSMLYLGTIVTGGRAEAVVTGTGTRSELGKIGRLVEEAPDETTPLEARLAQLGRRVVFLVLVIAVAVATAGWLRGDEIWGMLQVAISLAVAAVPESLPAVTTLVLALGIVRMSRHQAIVRRLPAVETLGSTTFICTDKTGTLTRNEMSVRILALPDGAFIDVDSIGSPVRRDIERLLRAAVLCNAASMRGSGENAECFGDPTEVALLRVAHLAGIEQRRELQARPKIFEQPFDAATRVMMTVHRVADGSACVAFKGAPAEVLASCTHVASGDGAIPMTASHHAVLLDANDRLAEQAYRVLAIADKRLPMGRSDVGGGFTFLGFAAMIDPPREEAEEALRHAREAGIRVIMLTGDQLHTANAIARELHINGSNEPRTLHSSVLRGKTEKEIVALARHTDAFARVSPAEKLSIVSALQDAGEVVAVTGDGVNDAPALKRADIGVAMGARGTEVAKEASDLVLADDNFATIVRAIEEGRTIYANIRRFAHLMFSHNLGEVLTIFVAIIAGWPLPLLPLQILWINIVTDVFPAFALAMEPAGKDTMKRAPRDPEEKLFSREFLWLISWQGALLAAVTLSIYYWALTEYGPGDHARTVAVFALVGVQIGHLFNCRSKVRSAFSGIFRNPLLWAAVAVVIALQFLAVSVSHLRSLLGLVVPTEADVVAMLISIAVPVIVVELVKVLLREARATARKESS